MVVYNCLLLGLAFLFLSPPCHFYQRPSYIIKTPYADILHLVPIFCASITTYQKLGIGHELFGTNKFMKLTPVQSCCKQKD